MSISYTEASYENSIIQLFEEMGYEHAYGPNMMMFLKIAYLKLIKTCLRQPSEMPCIS